MRIGTTEEIKRTPRAKSARNLRRKPENSEQMQRTNTLTQRFSISARRIKT